MNPIRVIISGGGTGGHIFPAVSIANAIRSKEPAAEILFVGAEGRMEMQRVPDAGYRIIGLPVRGLVRPLWSLRNISVLMDFFRSRRMVKKVITDFAPDVAVGVGGYASAPTLNAACSLGVPCLIQEQNSYAGVTNKSLAKKAERICVAYEGMERFFPKDKILLTGNPVRQSLSVCPLTRDEAAAALGLDSGKPVILIVGGSLGARTINESVLGSLDMIRQSGIQILWQTGKHYFETIDGKLKSRPQVPSLRATSFIADMDKAYAAADLVISRAGASSISELCQLGKPCILVPSPNVAEDHQTKNALALTSRNAALMVKDAEARDRLMPLALELVRDRAQLAALSENVRKLALFNSAEIIAEEVFRLAKSKKQSI
ncbi:MAG: undecaprenyldiphospho-muramoylpentapeptide beta-N-acetylglucosaminyltransferase [Bacteroidaceae bacterium]|nr:undecaprenyldiphospho-muramoylpentapeptide beta-N-acetylglucosaminyltransferase [Bacteroidaceae bacterium]